MPGIRDAEIAICTALGGFLFPGTSYAANTVGQFSGAAINAPGAPAVTCPVRLAVGTPTTDRLEKDIAAGVSNVFVARKPGFDRNTTRFAPYRKQLSSNTPVLVAALQGGAVTFGGGQAPNQIVSLRAGNTAYAYLTTAQDTPATVAAGLAAKIPTGQAVGAVLTADDIVSVRVACWQSGIFVTGQTESMVEMSIYAVPVAGAADGYSVRDAIGLQVGRLKSLQAADGSLTRFLALPDGSMARVLYAGANDDDTPRRADLWRRYMDFRVEYDDGLYENWPVMLVPLIVGNTNGAHVLWFGPGAPADNVLTDGQGNLLTDSAGAPLGGFN